MTIDRAIEILQQHEEHWQRLLKEGICDKEEGIDFLTAIKQSIFALEGINNGTFHCNMQCVTCDYLECPGNRRNKR